MSELLRINGLKIEARTDAGWREIVHGVDLTLASGEVLGLIGESGAGKSTIGLAAMGYARAGCRISAGEILFEGRNLLKLPKPALRKIQGARIAYVAQSAASAFNPAHRLLKQCIEVPVMRRLQNKPAAIAAAQALFARMRLPNPQSIGARFTHQVSGGQLQRMMTAMAMAPNPAIVVFDEPTTALDVTTQVEVLSAIRDAIRSLGMAAIYISHDLAVVAQMADRIMVLRHGKLVEQGTARAILESPTQAYTSALVAQRQFTKQHVPASTNPTLQIQSITAGYGKLNVLENISITARAGETVAIVGESGSGKSTLGRVVAGLLPPAGGQLLLNGAPLAPCFTARPRAQLRAIQLVHQLPDTVLNPEQIVRKILGRPLTFYFNLRGPQLEQRIRDLLTMVELPPETYLNRRPSELSGGQKQRICIARALAAEPELIICDEVTSALDPLIAEEILKLLDRLQRDQHLTYLFITHDLGTVAAIADRVVVMKNGKIIEQGTKTEIFTPPHDPYTELLLASTPQMAADWLDNILLYRQQVS